MKAWVEEIAEKAEKSHVMIGIEPTGHYWFTFAAYLKEVGMKLVLVSPMHVKRTKEMDDNDPGKSDRKDPKTIAKRVLEGRYLVPYVPEGVYAELRVCMNCRWRVLKELAAVENQIQQDQLVIHTLGGKETNLAGGAYNSFSRLKERP